jgi:hypothetical protein
MVEPDRRPDPHRIELAQNSTTCNSRRYACLHGLGGRRLTSNQSAALADPQQIYLREDLVTPAVNRWIGELFGRLNRQLTID